MVIKKAFTFIEIVVSLLLLTIIAAISIFTYENFSNSFSKSNAQSRMQAVFSAESQLARTYYQYSAWPGDLTAAASGGYTIINGTVSSPTQVSIGLSSSGYLGLATETANGTCVAGYISPPVGLILANLVYVTLPTTTPCSGGGALSAVPGSTKQSPVIPATIIH